MREVVANILLLFLAGAFLIPPSIVLSHRQVIFDFQEPYSLIASMVITVCILAFAVYNLCQIKGK